MQLQILPAMIAYLLLRIAARQSRCTMPAIRFADLVADGLFVRKPIIRIDKPPEINPARPPPFTHPTQIEIRYA